MATTRTTIAMLLGLGALGLVLLASPAFAEGAAAVPASAAPAATAAYAPDRAQQAFDEFAASWMQKLDRVEADNRSRQAAGGNGPTYLGYGDDFQTELRATGNPGSPYVGMLRYVEHTYECGAASAKDCKVRNAVPVTEIFRYRNGRWIY